MVPYLNICMVALEGGGGITNDLVNGLRYPVVGAVWNATTLGYGLRFTAGQNHQIVLGTSSLVNRNLLTFTMELLNIPTGLTGVFVSWQTSGSSDRNVYYTNTWRTRTSALVTDAFIVNSEYRYLNVVNHIFMIYDGNTKYFWNNGSLLKSAAALHAGSPVGMGDCITNGFVYVGDSGDSTSAGQSVLLFRLYSKALSTSDMDSLRREPYAMFKTGLAQRPYMNYGVAGEPPVTAPAKKKPQAIIMGYDKNRNPIIAYEPKAWRTNE